MVILHKRTSKNFIDYNEYHDRPFGLKWGTAYAMDELVKGIKANSEYALLDFQALEEMNRLEIDQVLSESYLYHKKVEIQLHLKDEFGRFRNNISGFFLGESYEDYFVIDETPIFWEDVRHVEIKKESKWFNIEMFDQKDLAALTKKDPSSLELERVKDEFYQPFEDE